MVDEFFYKSKLTPKAIGGEFVRKKPQIHKNNCAALFGMGFGLLSFALVANHHLANNRIYLLGFACCGLVFVALLLTFKFNYENSKRQGKK